MTMKMKMVAGCNNEAAELVAIERELPADERPTTDWMKRRREAEAKLAATPAYALADLRAKAAAVVATLDACDRPLVQSLARDIVAFQLDSSIGDPHKS